MHVSHIHGMTYKTNFNLTLNSLFETSKSAILFKKKNISEKFLDLYLMKIQINFDSKKFLDLYLVKIQISFVTKGKNFRSVFNENTY